MVNKVTRVKGCLNNLCASNHTLKKFDSSDNYCPKCGQKLVEVYKTKKCYHPLTENDGEYCRSCQDKKNKQKEQLKNAGIQAKNIGEQAIKIAPEVASFVGVVKKLKK